MLAELAAEMRKVAVEHPLDVKKNGIGNPFGPTRREVVIEGLPLQIVFTYTVLAEGMCAWHLSFSEKQHKPIPEDLLRRIKEAFLPEGKKILEIPSMWGPAVKQYIQMV